MPQFEIQFEWRPKEGVEAVMVWGEVLLRAQEVIRSQDLDLKTIKNIILTPETGKYTIDPHSGQRDTIPWVTKYIWKRGEPDNEATIYLWDDTSTEHTGSCWLNFLALGE